MIEYVLITGALYALGGVIGGAMWLGQGIRIMNDERLRTEFDYFWTDVCACTVYGILTSWFGIYMYWRYTR